MRNKFIKIISLILVVVTVMTSISCKNGGNGGVVGKKTIIKEASTEYSIVISANATPTETFAAEELSDFVKQVTNADMAIKHDTAVNYSNSAKIISIGETSLFRRSGIIADSTALNTDGFIIKNQGEMIFICGAIDRGTLYGVYDFLEKYLGVKFLTFDSTYVPQKSTVEIEKTLNIVEVPEFELRDYYSGTTKNGVFSARLRMECYGAGDMTRYGGSFSDIFYDESFHNTMSYVKSSPVWSEHKEWFNSAGNMICYTNGITDDDKLDTTIEESAVNAVINELKRKLLDSKPSEKFFMIGQEDHHAPCECDRCKASVARNTKSGMMIVWMNVICQAIEEWAKETIPEKEYYICCFSYQWSQPAPVKVDSNTGEYVPVNQNVVAHKDLYVMYAPISICYYHSIDDLSCSMNIAGREQLNGWSAITDRMLIWDYSCNYWNFLWWFPNISVLKENLQKYKELGVVMVRTQGPAFDKNSYHNNLLTYLLSKLMWDIDRNVYDLVEEFNQYYFEEGAEYMNDFINLLEGHFAMLNIHTDLYENTPTFLAAETYPLELLQNAIDLTNKGFEQIINSQKTDKEKSDFETRFTRARIQAEYMILRNIDLYGYSATAKGEFIDNFFKATDKLGITHFSERKTANQLKEQYGY